MFSSRAARLFPTSPLLRRTLTCQRTSSIRHATLRTLSRPLAQGPAKSLCRWQSQSTKQSASATVRSEFNRMTAALDLHTVYQAGRIRTVFVGTIRIVTIVVFGLALWVVSPNLYFNPEATNWWVPAVIVGGAIPLLLVHYLTAPYVATVRVLLPESARRSREALLRFANNVPPNTELRVQCFGWLPWPYHKRIFFEDLRRVPGAKLKLVNLEHVPLGKEEVAKSVEKTWSGKIAKHILGGYSIDRAQVIDKSQTPGAWDRMWEQIPLKGDEGKKGVKRALPPADVERPPWSSPSKPRSISRPPPKIRPRRR